MFVEKDKVKIMVSIPGFRIEGEAHIMNGIRFSDFLNEAKVDFVPLTNVDIFDWKGDFLYRSKFIAIHKDKIIWTTYVDELTSKQE